MRQGVSNPPDLGVGVSTQFSPRPPNVERDHVGLAALSARFEWKMALFAPQPDRRVLLGLNAPWPTSPRRIRFHRNHAIEYSLSVLRPSWSMPVSDQSSWSATTTTASALPAPATQMWRSSGSTTRVSRIA